MKLTIAKPDLIRALNLARGIARKSQVPILSHVLLRATDTLLVGATDLVVAMAAVVPAKIATRGGLAIAVGEVHHAISSAPADEIGMSCADGWLEIRSGKARYKLPAISDRDFPKLAARTNADVVTMSGAALHTLIDRTSYATCDDETRMNLNGVLLESNGERATMVGCDGHRVAAASMAGPCPRIRNEGVIIPKRALGEIAKLVDRAESCEVAIQGGSLFVTRDGVTISARLIDLKFPPVRALIPASHKITAVLGREALLAALKRIGHMTSDTVGVTVAVGDGKIALSVNHADRGEIADEIEAECSGKIAFGVNAKYAIDALGHMNAERVKLALGGELEPIVFTQPDDDTYTCVVMPMRN